MRQRNLFKIIMMLFLLSCFLPQNSHAYVIDIDSGETELGSITITRGQTVTGYCEEVDYYYNNVDYTIIDIYGWYTPTIDPGFYVSTDLNNKSNFTLRGYAPCYQQKVMINVVYKYKQYNQIYQKTFSYLVTVNDDTYTEMKRDVELAAAGTLSWHISSSEKNSITHLTLHGDINSDDLRFLREMAGSIDNEGNLRYLDMSDVHFVKGGNSYYNIQNISFFVSEGFDLPNYAFYRCHKLTEIWLPKKLKTIFEWVGLPATMPAHDVTVYASYETGIVDVTMLQGVRSIYTPNGKKLDKLQKGLNIVVMNDGRTLKVIVK